MASDYDGNFDSEFNGKSFDSEKKLCDYVDHNIVSFVTDILGMEYLSHKREYRIYRHVDPKGPRGPRADFYISTDKGPIIMEAKSPTQKRHELSRSLSQLLAQGSAYKRLHNVMPRMILLTSQYIEDVGNVIEDFGLPIEVILISKDYIAKVEGFNHG